MNKYQQAKALHENGELHSAKTLYEDYLNIECENGQAFDDYGILLAQLGEYQQAKLQFEQAIRYGLTNHHVYNHLANVSKQLGDHAQAITYFEKALLLDDSYAVTWNNLANVYFMKGDLKKAQDLYGKAISLQPDYDDALVNLALCANKQHDIATAKQLLKKAYEINKHNRQAGLLLGNFAFGEADYQQAINYYESVAQDDVLSPDAINNLAACYMKLDKVTEAEQLLYSLIDIFPDNCIAISNLANLLFLQDKFDEAIQQYNSLLTAVDFQYTANFNLGVIYMRQRKWEQALAHFEQVLQMNKDDINAHVNYATVQLRLNDKEDAIKHYQYALLLEPENEVASYRLAALSNLQIPKEAPSEYVKQLFDDYAAYFDIDLMEKLNYRLPDTLYKAVYPYLPDERSATIIDLGCGTGLSARLLTKHAIKIIGIDLSPKMLSYADKKGYYHQLICDNLINGLQRCDESADLIIAADVFVYLGDLQETFFAVQDRLKQEGKFIFTVERGTDQDYQLRSTGRYVHTNDYIRRLAKESGFNFLDEQLIVLRKQQGNEILGYLFVLAL